MRRLRLLVALLVTLLVAATVSLGVAPAATAAADRSLSTTFGTDGGILVHQFTFDADVALESGIDVAALGINAANSSPTTIELEIYTRPGSAVGHESSTDGWTLRSTVSATSVGYGSPTRVGVDLRLPTGLSAIKVIRTDPDAGNEIVGNNPQPASNDDLTLTGRSLSQFGRTYPGYSADFAVFYEPAAPTTVIDSGPSGAIASSDATFGYSNPSGDVDHFECDLTPAEPGGSDGFETCDADGTTYTDLAEGPHTFSVRAVDAAGNADATPATRDFIVNTQQPTITATVTSDTPPTAAGWYRSPVTLTYTCDPAGSTLAADCPTPVTLRRGGADRTVTRRVTTTDGDTASTVTVVSLDRALPRVRIAGFHEDRTYTRRPSIDCVAADDLSGVRGCHAVLGINDARTRITARARAVDNAGHVRVLTLVARYTGR